MSNPLQSGLSAFLSAPVNLWLKGSVESSVSVGGLSYNSLANRGMFRSLVGDIYINSGNNAKAATMMEMLSPLGAQQLKDYVVITEEVDPLRPAFDTVPLEDGQLTNEDPAQGNVLSGTSNATRDLIRQYFPNAHTTIQPQRTFVNGVAQPTGNPENNNIFCLLGVPDDYLEILPGQIFFNTAVSVYYNTNPKSNNYNNWIVTNGVANATNSPTSIASTADQTAGLSNVSGSAFTRVPYTYEVLMFERFVPQSADDIAARRRRGIFRRLVNYITAAEGSQISAAKSAGILPVGEFINAGWGSDANTPVAAGGATRVTGEVRLPFIPPGTRLVRGQANDGEASEPKVAFSRAPIPQDHFCMITRYGLLQVTDVASVISEHQREMAVQLANALSAQNQNTPYKNIVDSAALMLQSKQAMSDLIFDFKSGDNGIGTLSGSALEAIDEKMAAELLGSYLYIRSLPAMRLILQELSLQLLFGGGKLQNPISTPIANSASQFAALVFNPNRVPRETRGMNVNGQLVDGTPFDSVKFGSYSQGLLRSVPIENTFDMPAGKFDFAVFGEFARQWQSQNGADEGYLITDGVGHEQIINAIQTNPTMYREYQPTLDTFTGISVRNIEYSGMHLKVVVLPELSWATAPQEAGTMTFINFGTPNNANVFPFYCGTPMALLRNEQQNGKLINSIGLRTETGLICRGLKQNAFRIRRNA